METHNSTYWQKRYESGDTPWDIGHGSPALLNYVYNNWSDSKDACILIPGGGRAYEISQLAKNGFGQVFVCDWSESAIAESKRVNPDVPETQFLCQDFFALKGPYDLILEQTFFCAIPPKMRSDYVKKVHQLLQPTNGVLAGVFFDREFEHEGPPHGGSISEYKELFSPYFDIISSGWAEDSIEPRKGSERLIIAKAKSS